MKKTNMINTKKTTKRLHLLYTHLFNMCSLPAFQVHWEWSEEQGRGPEASIYKEINIYNGIPKRGSQVTTHGVGAKLIDRE